MLIYALEFSSSSNKLFLVPHRWCALINLPVKACVLGNILVKECRLSVCILQPKVNGFLFVKISASSHPVTTVICNTTTPTDVDLKHITCFNILLQVRQQLLWLLDFVCALSWLSLVYEPWWRFWFSSVIGAFYWHLLQTPSVPVMSDPCFWERNMFRKEAKWKFVTNIQCFPRSPTAAPNPRAPLQPCSELAGVFLYKRPILWDARKAMEAFEGHHTKAKRQALIPGSVPQPAPLTS